MKQPIRLRRRPRRAARFIRERAVVCGHSVRKVAMSMPVHPAAFVAGNEAPLIDERATRGRIATGVAMRTPV